MAMTPERLIRPASIAVIGASSQRVTAGNEVLANLREERFPGDIHVVHPTASQIDGIATTPKIGRLPPGVDVAVIALPAPKVLGALRELELAGCAGAVVPSARFTPEVTDDLRAYLGETRLMVHGPNNMGIINLTDRVPLWTQRGGISRLNAGNVALVAQSGAGSIFVPRSTRDGVYSKILSTGNEWGLTTADYVEWLSQDDATEAIGLVLESIADFARFRHAISLARSAGKPVAVLHVGRSAAGQRATTAHTGALATPDDFYSMLFDELDLPRANDYDELAAIMEAYSRPSARRAAGPRVAATMISGGQAALLADLAPQYGVRMAKLEPATVARLEELVPGLSGRTPLDVHGGAGGGAIDYAEVFRTLLGDSGVDTLMVVGGAQDSMSLAELTFEVPIWNAVDAAFPGAGKPILVVSSSARSLNPYVEAELRAPIPLLRGIRAALAAAAAIGANRPVRAADVSRAGLDEGEIARIRHELSGTQGPLAPALTARLLAAYGIHGPRAQLVENPEEVAAAITGMRFPVVVKANSPDIPHRTEAGCVLTGLTDLASTEAAVKTVLENALRLTGRDRLVIEVQEQVEASLEAVVGFTSSPPAGVAVIVGTGGVLVELLADRSGALAPVDAETATAMIENTAFGKRLGGYRGLVPPTDPAPLADLVRRVSLLAADFAGLLTDGDLNPVLVRPGSGVPVVVDALLVRA
ncbi:acetate--CoA ligase family protein [Nonomuraea sp. NPDC046570]|uniref:acetate--CoA ligase family protein n=1 Tax=Nonomuraea sp. NPDC046570 TaxID=3155255 RepID=UPI0033E2A845